jgi:hypothetical protein
MRSSVTMNPTGGVIWRRDIVLPDPGDPLQFVKELRVWSLTARLRLGRLWEPPGADPHAVVVWGLGGAIPPATRFQGTNEVSATIPPEARSASGGTS